MTASTNYIAEIERLHAQLAEKELQLQSQTEQLQSQSNKLQTLSSRVEILDVNDHLNVIHFFRLSIIKSDPVSNHLLRQLFSLF